MDKAETVTGGQNAAFPPTRWTLLQTAANPTAPDYHTSLEALAATYWRPVYAHFRRKWKRSIEEAKDLTQEFFAFLYTKDFFHDLSTKQGRFRSYVLATLDNFVRRRHRDENRLKRGGGAIHLNLEEAEIFEPSSGETPEHAFSRDWARALLEEALEELESVYRERGMEQAYQLFHLHDVEPPIGTDVSYAALAERFGMTVTDVTNLLYRTRKDLRERVLKRVRDTVSSDEEAEIEMRNLFDGVAGK